MIQELQALTLAHRVKDKKPDILKAYNINESNLISEEKISFNTLINGNLKEMKFDEEEGFDVETISNTINSQNSMLVDLME